MNVQCSHCNTVFRVDPAKVPAGGLRARCSICRGIFAVSAPEGSAAAESAAAPAAPAPTTVPIPAHDPVPPPAPEPESAPAAASTVAEPAAAAAGPAPPAEAVPSPAPAPAPAPRPAAGGSPFNLADPNAKMRRLARALVSDIVMYHPERRDQALEAGTLKKEFMDEIKKSWEEYVAQVGTEKARSTPHFRDALNDILARGQAIF